MGAGLCCESHAQDEDQRQVRVLHVEQEELVSPKGPPRSFTPAHDLRSLGLRCVQLVQLHYKL